MTSSYQMAVLLQYNNNDTLSLDELVAATAINKEILTQVLSLLVKAKILVNEETDQYDLNPGLFLSYDEDMIKLTFAQVSNRRKSVLTSIYPLRLKLKQKRRMS